MNIAFDVEEKGKGLEGKYYEGMNYIASILLHRVEIHEF